MKGATSDHGILDVLDSCRLTIDWMSVSGPVELAQLPLEHLDNLKVLEKLGIVFRRNNKTMEIAKQRLRRVLECEARG